MLESVKKKIKTKLGVPSVAHSLDIAKINGFNPKVIYDIGAYEGTWTKEISNIFPKADFYMFEAQNSKEETLRQVCSLPMLNIHYHIGLLGAESGNEVVFHEYETASSVCEEYVKTEANKKVKYLETLESVVEKRNWPKPDLLKLDTQGYELEILKGATSIAKFAELILMEVSLLEIYKDAPLIEEVLLKLSALGFQVYDICSLMRRPLDSALYQVDLLFVRKDSQLIASKRWA